ncbi:MAG: HAMP domain-containing protein [Candidatus Hydrogenedens sp.]|nr:HAMP domain-containing protein [Candidatus Hydrogenedens sp.]
MLRQRLIWQLFPAFLLIALTALVAAALFITQAVRSHLLTQFEQDLAARALLLAPQFDDHLASGDYTEVNALCGLLDAATEAHIMVYRMDGSIAGDSRSDEGGASTQALPPEVLTAKNGTDMAFSERENRREGQTMLYTAYPIMRDGAMLGVVRVGQSLAPISRAVQAMYFWLLIGGTLVAAGVAVVSWRVSHRIIHPIEQMKQGAIRFASGKLDMPVALPEAQEMAELAEAMNTMARQLDDRIRTAVEQRNEQEAILSSMVEGVVAVNRQQHIFSMNRAATRLFEVDPERVQGKSIHFAIRNSRLIEIIGETLKSGGPVSAEIQLHKEREVLLQAHAAGLKNAAGEPIGVVVVLNDVTDLRRLERIRSDFVANVSHELKTPITSIKGFVETMLDGSVDNPEDTRRFLGIVAKQADRLHTIIEDLLTLSRIEREEEVGESYLSEGAVRPVLEGAVQICGAAADSKDIRVAISCADTLRARINAPLLEQGLINLIDNAIKYSDAGGEVQVSAEERNDDVRIRVSDRGCGIPGEHLPRLFERFYRVDKARSRAAGGTGLGLAIVKHIAHTHGGRITVESRPGEGSTFTMHLPKPKSAGPELRIING